MTSHEQYEREQKIFLAAVKKPPDEREAFVEEACAGDSELFEGALELLALDDGKYEAPPSIPDYRFMQRLGEGGMGDVWLAEQTGEITRQVAVKVIKQGMGSKHVVARFELERQTLALMKHRCIASVYEAGTTSDGRPYVALEYVAGMPITMYCDRHQLSIRDRLQLFQQVCAGVAHAHQNAIIHRDLKPSNILVAVEDGEAVPKIIDFGIAKALTQPADHAVTTVGQLIGTPAYMSPQQAEMAADLDTRTDVYSLGIILYELLVGAPPYEIANADIGELRRLLREDEPKTPRAMLQSLENSETIASNRGTTPGDLEHQLHWDLDVITMKAIEKDREQRYSSPTDLSRDITRHLNHEPVTARPPSWRYRTGKFVRRHTLGVAAAAALTLALVAGITGTYSGMVQAKRAEARARAEARTAQRVTEFLEDTFTVSDPDDDRAASVTARELLEAGVKGISDLDDEPAVQAALLVTMGRVYRKLGRYEEAQRLLERAVAIREDLFADQRSDYQELKLAEGLNGLANVYANHGQLSEAEHLFERAVALLKQQHENPSAERMRRYAIAIFNLAETYRSQGRYAEVESLGQEALSLFEELDHTGGRAAVLNTLGLTNWRLGKVQLAEAAYRHAIALWEEEDAQRLVAKGLFNLAILYKEQLCLKEAEEHLAHALEIREEILGPNHPEIAEIDQSMGGVHLRREEWEQSQTRYERALAIRESAYDENNPKLASTLNNLGDALFYLQKIEEAASFFLRARRIWERNDHPSVAFSLHGLANVRREQGDYYEAERLYQEALQIRQDAEGEDHLYVGDILEDYAVLLKGLKRNDEAAEFTKRVKAIREQRATEHLPCAEQN